MVLYFIHKLIIVFLLLIVILYGLWGSFLFKRVVAEVLQHESFNVILIADFDAFAEYDEQVVTIHVLVKAHACHCEHQRVIYCVDHCFINHKARPEEGSPPSVMDQSEINSVPQHFENHQALDGCMVVAAF